MISRVLLRWSYKMVIDSLKIDVFLPRLVALTGLSPHTVKNLPVSPNTSRCIPEASKRTDHNPSTKPRQYKVSTLLPYFTLLSR
jgi:hypothetical protein